MGVYQWFQCQQWVLIVIIEAVHVERLWYCGEWEDRCQQTSDGQSLTEYLLCTNMLRYSLFSLSLLQLWRWCFFSRVIHTDSCRYSTSVQCAVILSSSSAQTCLPVEQTNHSLIDTCSDNFMYTVFCRNFTRLLRKRQLISDGNFCRASLRYVRGLLILGGSRFVTCKEIPDSSWAWIGFILPPEMLKTHDLRAYSAVKCDYSRGSTPDSAGGRAARLLYPKYGRLF